MNQVEAAHTARHKLFHEANKEFDESMLSLIEWLKLARGNGYLTQDEVQKIFDEELEKRLKSN